jgi:serine/threonine protein kinase/class 3 adenylate cyclase
MTTGNVTQPIHRATTEGATEATAGLAPERFLSAGPDGTAVLARNPFDQRLFELRFVSALRADPDRWSALAHRLTLVDRIAVEGVRKLALIDLDGHDPLRAIEPAPGPSLFDWLSSHGPCEPSLVASILDRLAFALGAGHRLSLAHGMLSPDTVWIDGAHKPHIELTSTRVSDERCPWARAFVAPEVRAGAAPDAASDLYALGMLGLSLLAGGDPTAQTTHAHDDTHNQRDALRALLSPLIARDPDERPSAAEWTMNLRECRDSGERSTTAVASDTLSEHGAEQEPSPVKQGAQLGRYYLVRRLGEGGMGEVWEGMDLGTGQSVAVKIMRPSVARDAVFLRRFRKEARTLAAVRGPYTANFIEINEDRGLHYLVMEFVEGRSVASVLDERGPFSEREALAIIADACRALIEPHRMGVVHRDLKPDNLMFVRKDEPLEGASDERRQRVKVCDFGIARETDGNATQVTQDGILLGTPAYMSPEQCRGVSKVSPASDVYSLGATLFELLTGKLVFEEPTPMGMVVKHLSEPAPSVRAVRDSVSENTANIVARALAKEPTERYSDAEALLEAIEELLYGRPAVADAHPSLPAKGRWTRTFVFEWQLDSAISDLWPYLSNTEKINRALGLAPVKYLQRGVVKGVSERFAATKAFGMALEWKEEPFEWIEGKKHSVVRTFEKGLLRWYCAETALSQLPSGKTLLRNTITIDCRGWVGYFATPLQVGVQYRRAAERMVRRLDALLSKTAALDPSVDALEPAVKLATGAEATLTEAVRALQARQIAPEVAEGVVHFLRVASDSDVSRIRPLALANRLRLPREAVADACLHLASQGVLVLLWDVLCPSCQIPTTIAESLEKIEAHGSCATCNIDFALDFGRSVELVFRAGPRVREVETRTFCVGGPGNFPHVIAQLRLARDERVDVAFALGEGTYKVRSAQLPYAYELRVRESAMRHRADLHFAQRALAEPKPVEMRAGEQRLALSNGCDRELLLRVERARDDSLALTAARASAMRVFRELFGEQVLAAGALVSVGAMTLMSTAVHDSAALFRAMGDSEALSLVLEHFRVIADVVGAHGGALLKTVGAQSVAAFDRPASAVEAAMALREALSSRPALAKLAVRCAVHQGPMVAATVSDRLDYFGRNAELALALPHELDHPGLLLSQPVADDSAVRALLRARGVTERPVHVRSAGLDAWGVEVTTHAER